MKTDLIEGEKTADEYLTHVIINGKRIIPSDSFAIEGSEYLLLEILNSSDDILFLKIIGIKGANMGNLYFIPKIEFEDKTILELNKSLRDYQH